MDMASGEHSCTRRVVLGAAVAAVPGASLRIGGASPEREAEWRSSLAAFRAAEAEMRAFEAASSGSHRPFEEQWALDERFSDLVVACNGALRRLLRTPAPDLAALALKIELAVDRDAAAHSGGEACMAALKADARRLAAAAA